MLVGHSMVAFAVVAGAGGALGWSRGRALRAGAAAAAFALVPDVDMAYTPVAAAVAEGGSPSATLDAFWTEMARIHRLGTHFVTTGAVAAVGVSAVGVGLGWLRGWRRGADSRRLLGIGTAAAGVAVIAALLGWTLDRFAPLDAAMLALYSLAGVGVAVAAVRRLDLDGRAVLAAAAAGLVTHPFGDLFAGEPPTLFYPLAIPSPETPLQPFADPTLDFLAVFGLELATVWLAVLVFRALTGTPNRAHLDARVLLGVPYAAVALVAPVPAPDVWYYPEFSLAVTGSLGLLVVRPGALRWSIRGVVTGWFRPGRPTTDGGDWDRPGRLRDATTGLAAVTLATVCYALGHLLVAG